jgi:hypothetical protein
LGHAARLRLTIGYQIPGVAVVQLALKRGAYPERGKSFSLNLHYLDYILGP